MFDFTYIHHFDLFAFYFSVDLVFHIKKGNTHSNGKYEKETIKKNKKRFGSKAKYISTCTQTQ